MQLLAKITRVTVQVCKHPPVCKRPIITATAATVVVVVVVGSVVEETLCQPGHHSQSATADNPPLAV